jgi:peptidoglycan hydrolase CwlO-like protein
MRKKNLIPVPVSEQLAFSATKYIGSIPSLIIHTIFFVGIFTLYIFGYSFETILLILTTVVSLEAIYLSIFIQMTVNKQGEIIAEVSEDVEDISEEVEEISKDIDELQEDIEEISDDVDELSEEIEEDDQDDARERAEEVARIEKIEGLLADLLVEIKSIREKK